MWASPTRDAHLIDPYLKIVQNIILPLPCTSRRKTWTTTSASRILQLSARILSLRILIPRSKLIQRHMPNIVGPFYSHVVQPIWSKLLVYYRLFTNSIGITSRQPAHVDNPYLGRVARNSISPPQAALHFKRRLCSVENIRGFPSFSLYLSASNKSPMDDGDRIPALESTIDNPMELVVEIPYREMTKRTDKAYPHAQYSTRPTSISRYLLILFQFIIASTRKMASLSRKRLSKLILITPRLLHASTRI